MTTTNPGLDTTALRALRAPRHDTDAICDRISTHLNLYDGYLAFSGGKDSLVTLDLARRVDPNIPVAFFDSGLEWPETYRYLADLREAWSLNLHIYRARHTILELMIASGTWNHHATTRTLPDVHQILIGEPSTRAHDDTGPGELWGVRADESTGRDHLYRTHLTREREQSCHGCCTTNTAARNTHGGIIRRADGTVAYGPVWNWTTNDIWAHIHRHNLPANPVYAKLERLGAPAHAHRVAAALDAAHLHHGRLVWLKRGWPDLYADLATLLPRITELT